MDYVALFLGGMFFFGLISFLKTALHVTKEMWFRDNRFFIKSAAVALFSAIAGAYFGAVEIKIFVTGVIGFLLYLLYETMTSR